MCARVVHIMTSAVSMLVFMETFLRILGSMRSQPSFALVGNLATPIETFSDFSLTLVDTFNLFLLFSNS